MVNGFLRKVSYVSGLSPSVPLHHAEACVLVDGLARLGEPKSVATLTLNHLYEVYIHYFPFRNIILLSNPCHKVSPEMSLESFLALLPDATDTRWIPEL